MVTTSTPADLSNAVLTLRMLGRLEVTRCGVAVELAHSRKVRALLAYLALAPHPLGRSRLCELLGDVSNDPKGELRWCLSRLRASVDELDRPRVSIGGEMISLDLDGCFVDALQIDAAVRAGLDGLSMESLRRLEGLFAGDFLEGLQLYRSPQLDHWLVTQRGRYRASHAATLERLTEHLAADPRQARPYAERWVELTPYDARAQIILLRTLLECGLPVEAEQHLAATARLFHAEDVEFETIARAWRDLRAASAEPPLPRPAMAHENETEPPVQHAPRRQRAALAIMPFAEPDGHGGQGGLADGLTHDIITRLAKLRNLFVIARGSVFALSQQGLSPEDAARRLDVEYFTTGVIKRRLGRIEVSVELVEARTIRIVWSETFELTEVDAFLLLDAICNMIVSSIANEIEAAERNRAILKPPSSLNAWEAYHRGLWHMYRFTKADNALAYQFFTRSADADPTFARAFAGISFTHWQNAFQHWDDRDHEADLAFESAGRSLIVDDHDPAAHWAMGRALWLRSSPDQAVIELERAVDLSPNYALGHYALAFVQSQSGDPAAAIASSDHSRSLSPFDPLLFGMLGARAMAHVRLGQYEEAAHWAIKASARPNAHNIILAIAALCLALAGRIDEGRIFAATIHRSLPDFGVEDFLATFRFSPEAEAQFRIGARRLGLM